MTISKSHTLTAAVYLLLAAALMFGACAGVAPAGTVADKPVARRQVKAVDRNTSRRLSYFFLEATRRQQMGDYASAIDLLHHCLDINPDAAEVYSALAPYYSSMGDDSTALMCMRRAADLRPDNSTYMERLAETSINMQLFDDAIDAYEKLYSTNHSRTDVLNMLLRLYGQKNDYPAMIHTINRIENEDGGSERITLARMRVYSLQGDTGKQLEELNSLCSQHPDDMNFRVMKGNWLLQNHRPADALKEYDYVLNLEPDNRQALMSMLDYYKYMGEDSLFSALRERLLLSVDMPMKTRVTLMMTYVKEHSNDTTEVTDLFKRILAEPQKSIDMYELYYSYMQLMEMPVDSIEPVLHSALAVEPDNAAARYNAILIRWEKEDMDSVIALCEPAMEFNPDEMAFYYFCGMAYFMQQDTDKALDIFKRGVSQIDGESDKNIVSDFYAIMGDIFYEKEQRDEAFAAYDSSLHWKSDNISCLNNYAYYLCVSGLDLQRAEQMSYKTIKAEPANSTYLDTYAWVLFKERRYEEARMFIDQAVANDTAAGAVILEHAGDIYAMNGDIETAVDYWQRAVAAGAGGEAILRKIKTRRYIEDEQQ